LAQQSKGLGRGPEVSEEAVPYLASSVSVVRAEAGLWAGRQRSGRRVGAGAGKSVLLRRLRRGLCPGRCGAVAAPRAAEGAESGRGAEMGVVLCSRDVALSWQGRSRVEDIRILVSHSRGLAAFVCQRE